MLKCVLEDEFVDGGEGDPDVVDCEADEAGGVLVVDEGGGGG